MTVNFHSQEQRGPAMTRLNAATDLPGNPPLTEAELAARWQVSRRTLQRLRHEGRLPEPFRIGRKILYRAAEITAFEAASPNTDRA